MSSALGVPANTVKSVRLMLWYLIFVWHWPVIKVGWKDSGLKGSEIELCGAGSRCGRACKTQNKQFVGCWSDVSYASDTIVTEEEKIISNQCQCPICPVCISTGMDARGTTTTTTTTTWRTTTTWCWSLHGGGCWPGLHGEGRPPGRWSAQCIQSFSIPSFPPQQIVGPNFPPPTIWFSSWLLVTRSC